MKHRALVMFFTALLFSLLQFVESPDDPSFQLLFALLRYAIPALLGFSFLSLEEKKYRDEDIPAQIPDLPTSFSLRQALRLIPLIFPVVFTIIFTSYLTQEIAGQTLSAVTGNYWKNLWWHALLPALGEEILFRYLPIRLLGANRRLCLPVSAALFAVMHGNFLQMPYALVAGIFFCSIDLCFNSLVPSIILHFCTNVVSLTWMSYGYEDWFQFGFLPVALLLTVLSLIYLFIKRQDLITKWTEVFHSDKAEETNDVRQ